MGIVCDKGAVLEGRHEELRAIGSGKGEVKESKESTYFKVFLCMSMFAYVCVSCMCLLAKRPEEGIRSPITRVTDGWELPHGR